MEKTNRKQKVLEMLFVVTLTILCLIWSIKMPYRYGSDEEMKMDICKYIYQNGKLPTGGDEAVRDGCWGISYAFTPILDYTISGMFMKIVSVVTTNDQALLVAARFPSVLSYMGTLIMSILISKKLFKENRIRWLFLIFIACLPELIFLGSYINNDCFALFCTSIIIYSWIIGLKTNWNIKSCVILGIGIGLCALSYYNAYGFILTSAMLFIISFIKNQKEEFLKKQFWKKGILIFAIAFALAGWWFIRSYILYNGDFLGLQASNEYGEKYGINTYKPSQRITPSKKGQNLMQMLIVDNWLWQTICSFIAVFGNTNVVFPVAYYIFFVAIYVIALVALFFKHREDKKNNSSNVNIKMIELMFILSIIITFSLSIDYSYFSDFQPQGRYILPILIPFMYFIVNGLQYLLNKTIKDERRREIAIDILIIIIGVVGVTADIVKIF